LKLRYSRIIIMVVIVALTSFATGTLAASNIQQIKAFLRHDFQVFVSGKKVDVGPVLVYDNRSYLPLAQIGETLGADVSWNESNLGIYVNPRIYTKPDPSESKSNTYSDITMVNLQGYMASYRGQEEPVLSITTMDYGVTYYRVKDIKRLNIDLSGLKLAMESRTKELYVSDKELAKATQEMPVFNYIMQTTLVIGEKDQEKLEVLNNYIETIPAMYKLMNPEIDYYPVPILYVIDALPDNEYNMIGVENGEYMLYWVKLKQNILDKWYTSEYRTTSLGSIYPQLYPQY